MNTPGIKPEETQVRTLGPCTFPSPLEAVLGAQGGDFPGQDVRIPQDIYVVGGQAPEMSVSFEKSGPSRTIFFDPNEVTAGILSCGGLCPGLNNVIRALVMELHYKYHVRKIYGIPYGFRGLSPEEGLKPVALLPENVTSIHTQGGSILGTSRGKVDAGRMVDVLSRMGVNLLFCMGGDGTQRGLHELAQTARDRGMPIAVVGLPKTIDNDIPFVYKTFGLDTAVTVASEAIRSAHTEAESAYNGIGLVKLMGRSAGFIASYATLANLDVNFCLIPEIDFDLDGPGGLLDCLERRLYARKHAVIVVAEGAGQKFFEAGATGTDLSGNPLLNDIGLLLKTRIKEHFKARNIPVDLKYIDPSYMLRAVGTDANDSVFTADLARHAVHAGMAGKTDMMVGYWHGEFINVPLPLVLSRVKRVNPGSGLWQSVLSATGQPRAMKRHDGK